MIGSKRRRSWRSETLFVPLRDVIPPEFLLKVIALLSSALFAGAAYYLTAVEHPARCPKASYSLCRVPDQLQAGSALAGVPSGHLFSFERCYLVADEPMGAGRESAAGC
jgi:hypothetical protein